MIYLVKSNKYADNGEYSDCTFIDKENGEEWVQASEMNQAIHELESELASVKEVVERRSGEWNLAVHGHRLALMQRDRYKATSEHLAAALREIHKDMCCRGAWWYEEGYADTADKALARYDNKQTGE